MNAVLKYAANSVVLARKSAIACAFAMIALFFAGCASTSSSYGGSTYGSYGGSGSSSSRYQTPAYRQHSSPSYSSYNSSTQYDDELIYINSGGKRFQVQKQMLDERPKLILLILRTESMEDDERQYWFDILPSMSTSQKDRLFDILETERKKLAALEEKYMREIRELNARHLREWQEHEEQKAQQFQEKSQSTSEPPPPLLDDKMSDKYTAESSDGQSWLIEALKPSVWDFVPIGKVFRILRAGARAGRSTRAIRRARRASEE